MDVCLRDVKESDCDLLYLWRNQPQIVQLSKEKKKVDYIDHRKWFITLDPNETRVFIIETDKPIGQITFERASHEYRAAVISIIIIPTEQSRGYGIQALQQGIKKIFLRWDIWKLYAKVLADNSKSKKAFRKAGFKFIGTTKDICLYEYGLENFRLGERGKPKEKAEDTGKHC